MVFDCAVNQGVDFAIRTLQGILRVWVDGRMGPQTLEAVRTKNAAELIDLFAARRIVRYSEIKNWQIYKKGWIARVLNVHRQCCLF
jgi:lysozyme family protein